MGRGPRGFSLIEVMLAVLILGVGILAVMAVFPGVFALNQNAWNTTTALSLAQDKMDELLANNAFINASAQSDNPVELSNCTRRWWGAADPSGNAALQLITVQVSWREHQRVRSISISSTICP